MVPEYVHIQSVEGHWKPEMEGGILRTNIDEGKYEPKLEFPTRKGEVVGEEG